MRSEEEVGEMCGLLGNHEGNSQWRGDNFKYGLLVGKLIALGWVLDDPIGDMKNHYEYEDWIQELRAEGPGPGKWFPPEE